VQYQHKLSEIQCIFPVKSSDRILKSC